jgi:ectoine hydroxylase-related dioxygenase (phytanoyl-CoA dioxygenase family)
LFEDFVKIIHGKFIYKLEKIMIKQKFTKNYFSKKYEEEGFIFPIDVVGSQEINEIRKDFEEAEAELLDDPERLGLLRSYPAQLLPSFDKLIRNENLIAAASAVLGPNLMVWSSGMFIKEANSSKIVTWHQDLTYWGLDDEEETTCWVALSKANQASGCMKFIPGSHKEKIVPHLDTFDDNNLLSRGQEIAVEVDEKKAVTIELEAGQASMHHGHLFHASGPNETNDRRIGCAIRYIKPSMKQLTGDASLVTLVSGVDEYGHFTNSGKPYGRLNDKDFEKCSYDTEIKRRILYEGSDATKGKRY